MLTISSKPDKSNEHLQLAALAEGHKTKCHVVFVHQGALFGRSLIFFVAYSTSTKPAH